MKYTSGASGRVSWRPDGVVIAATVSTELASSVPLFDFVFLGVFPLVFVYSTSLVSLAVVGFFWFVYIVFL
jgi:hypothetical protein